MPSNEVSIIIRAKNLASKTIGFVRSGLSKLSGAARKMGAYAQHGFRLFRNGAMAAGAALAGLLKIGNDFRQQMAMVNTMLPAGATQMRSFTKEVIRLSAELGLAKDTLANGLYQTLSAGIPADNAIEFLTVAAKAAVAGVTDVATAVDGLTTVINAYGIDAKHASIVSDIMFAIVRDGKITFGELAANIAKVAPIAKVAGLTLRQLGATIAALVKVEKPDRAMTALTAAMTEAAERGKTLFELLADFEGVDFEGIIAAGITKRSASAIALLSGNMAVLNKEFDRFNDTAGAAEDAFSKMDAVRFWQKAWQSILAIATEFGMVLDRAIQPKITAIAARIADLRDMAEGLAKALTAGGEARGTVLRTFGEVIIGVFKIGAMEVANVLHRAFFMIASKLPGMGHLGVYADPNADPFRQRDKDAERDNLLENIKLLKVISDIRRDDEAASEIRWEMENGKWKMIRKVARAAQQEKEQDQIDGIDRVKEAEIQAIKETAAIEARIAAQEHADKLQGLNAEIARAQAAFQQAQNIINKPFDQFVRERQEGQAAANEELDRQARIDRIRGKQAKRGLTISREDQAFIDMVDAFNREQMLARQAEAVADADRILAEKKLADLNKDALERDKDKLKALKGIRTDLAVLLRAPGGA